MEGEVDLLVAGLELYGLGFRGVGPWASDSGLIDFRIFVVSGVGKRMGTPYRHMNAMLQQASEKRTIRLTTTI